MPVSWLLQLKQDRTWGVRGSFSSSKIGPRGSLALSAEARSDPEGPWLLQLKQDRTRGVRGSFSSSRIEPWGSVTPSAEANPTPRDRIA
jgi:hypothetical protein